MERKGLETEDKPMGESSGLHLGDYENQVLWSSYREEAMRERRKEQFKKLCQRLRFPFMGLQRYKQRT